jgi:hypothetical protein
MRIGKHGQGVVKKPTGPAAMYICTLATLLCAAASAAARRCHGRKKTRGERLAMFGDSHRYCRLPKAGQTLAVKIISTTCPRFLGTRKAQRHNYSVDLQSTNYWSRRRDHEVPAAVKASEAVVPKAPLLFESLACLCIGRDGEHPAKRRLATLCQRLYLMHSSPNMVSV